MNHQSNIRMHKKKVISLGFVTLLLLTMTLAVGATPWDGVPDDNTPADAIWVDPKNTTNLDIGATFVVDILVNLTTGMFGFQYKFYWNSSVLQAVEIQTHSDKIPSGDLLPGWTGVFVAQNETAPGSHNYSVSAIGGVPFTGVDSLCTYTFQVAGRGSCTLDIYGDILADDAAEAIDHTTVDGYIIDPFPRARFTHSPLYPSANQTLTFNASASFDLDGEIVSYAWDFGDGATDAGMVVYHNYTANDAYNVTLTVTDDDSLTDTTWYIVRVGTVAVFTYSPEFPLTGDVVSFNATESHAATPPIANYSWNFGDGTKEIYVGLNLTDTATHIYTAAGAYNVTLTVTDNEPLTDTTWHIVKVGRWPVADFEYSPSDPHVNDTVRFDASASHDEHLDQVGEIVSYAWDFGDETSIVTETDPIVTHNYTMFGTYNVTLTVTDNETLPDSASVLITVLAEPIANFTWSPEQPQVDETVAFDASASYDPDGTITGGYLWEFGDGSEAAEVDPSANHTYSDIGTYNVTLKVEDDDGLTHTVTRSITVIIASSSISIGASPKSLELGENTTISGSITPERTKASVTLYYRFAGGTWETLTTVTTDSDGEYSHVWTPLEVGTYEVKASWPGDTNTLGAESSIETITVEEAEEPEPEPEPLDYLPYVAIVIVVVILAAVAIYFLKIRKS